MQAATVNTQHQLPLALLFQELFTAIVRIRAGRSAIQNSEALRTNVRYLLKQADQLGRESGYREEDVRRAMYAVVAFLDESVIPVFRDWERAPLGPEWFAGHVGGERFYDELRRLLESDNTALTGHLLEVYELCLLLGYRGKFGNSNEAGVQAIIDRVSDKLARIRGDQSRLSPRGLPGAEARTRSHDMLSRALAIAVIVLAVVAALVFTLGKLQLGGKLADLPAMLLKV